MKTVENPSAEEIDSKAIKTIEFNTQLGEFVYSLERLTSGGIKQGEICLFAAGSTPKTYQEDKRDYLSLTKK